MAVPGLEPLLEVTVRVDAPPATVWSLVADVTRYPEWSRQVASTRLRGGFEAVGPGAEFTNRNVHGELVWTTHAVVTAYETERRLAFRVVENYAVWSFELVPDGEATTLVHRRETPEGISDLSAELTDGFMGGQEAFTQELLAGMRRTVEGIREVAECRV